MLTVWAVTPIPALFHLLDLFLEKVWWVLKKQDLVFAVQTAQTSAVLARAPALGTPQSLVRWGCVGICRPICTPAIKNVLESLWMNFMQI